MRPEHVSRNAFIFMLVASLALVAAPAALGATSSTGGAAPIPTEPTGTGGAPTATPPSTTPSAKAVLQSDGTALAPASAPARVKSAIAAANQLIDKPYVWGGGHRRWNDRGYDCSGAASYVLRAAGVVQTPLDAVQLGRLPIMGRGLGQWITYYWNHQHGYLVIAGRRFDTSGPGPKGPRWRATARVSWSSFFVRHPNGL